MISPLHSKTILRDPELTSERVDAGQPRAPGAPALTAAGMHAMIPAAGSL
ncbi:MAG: hypothetical protein IPK27_12075 [Rhodanobacteraceae bacterium]|nr:hypothetical protein [Rhodanobacteraceae bacterium]